MEATYLDNGGVSFSLGDDEGSATYDGALTADAVKWLETFVGPMHGMSTCGNLFGPGWEYQVISTTGITDRQLCFDNPSHAAMFKLAHSAYRRPFRR